MRKSIGSCWLLSMLAALAANGQALPPRKQDADNLHEAAGMAFAYVKMSEAARVRCAQYFPDLAPLLDAYHLVHRVEMARYETIAREVIGAKWSNMEARLAQDLGAIMSAQFPDASADTRQLCQAAASQWPNAIESAKQETPKFIAFLDEYEQQHPFDYWTEEGFPFVAGCAKQALNRRTAPALAESTCRCLWKSISEHATREEYEAFGRAAAGGKLAESPEARKVASLGTDCALAAVDQSRADPAAAEPERRE
ncbi:MAG TPA: hypothetical protein VFL14_00245 [Xanthomonadales bacterium]|nr:hypothetical protein [Xanthomonadales bacterium]